MGLVIDASTDELESTLVRAPPFYEAFTMLRQEGYDVATVEENSRIRMTRKWNSKTPSYGNYVSNCGVYCKGEPGIIVTRPQFLMNEDFLRTLQSENQALYYQFREQVEEDNSKDPVDRRAMLMPSEPRSFDISPTDNSEHFEMIFGRDGNLYLEFLNERPSPYFPKKDKIRVIIPLPQFESSKYKNYTFVYPVWFGAINNGSRLITAPENSFMDDYYDLPAVRGVRRIRSA